MTAALELALAPERLEEGTPEEKASFGLFTIRHQSGSLTEGFDSFINNYRAGPLVSTYFVAEWLAWNWWRLRWEPRSGVAGWQNAHAMNGIGEGYLWPNLTIWSDGVRTTLISEPSTRADAKPFRYVGAVPVIMPSSQFEAAIDAFVPQILARLEAENIRESNLSKLWKDVNAERRDAALSRRRKLEAYLGQDPDESDDQLIDTLLADEAQLGRSSVEEVAAHVAGRPDRILTAADFNRLAKTGHEARPRDAVRLDRAIEPGADVPAWRVGADAARRLREQENLGDGAISNARLEHMAAVERGIIDDRPEAVPMSFALQPRHDLAHIVLRSRYESGRRFDLARVIGDSLLNPGSPLHPATRSSTWRQKAQRAFAAEFLSPFSAVDDFCDGDYSLETQADAAEHFNVSPIAISTLLKNHGRIDTVDARDLDAAA